MIKLHYHHPNDVITERLKKYIPRLNIILLMRWKDGTLFKILRMLASNSFWLQCSRSQKYMFLWMYINTSSDVSFLFVLAVWKLKKIPNLWERLKLKASLWNKPISGQYFHFIFHGKIRNSKVVYHGYKVVILARNEEKQSSGGVL